MARNTTITDKQILDAAREVFLEEGFSGQTAKIAKRAQVSEGSIFKRFPTKEALFYAALEIEQFPAWHTQVDQLTADWQGKKGLVSLFAGILLYFNDIVPRMITTMGSRVGMLPKKAFAGLATDPPTRDRRKLTSFLQQAMNAGHLRAASAEILAQLLLGAALESIMYAMMNNRQLAQDDFEAIAEGTFEVIWNGIGPA